MRRYSRPMEGDLQETLYRQQLENDKQFNDYLSFKNTIEQNLKKQQSINYVPINPKHLQETCLDIASKDGLTGFVRLLLQQGAKPNRINETYNRAPIHFATEGGHVDTLAVLLAEPTINPNFEAEQQTALHIAVNRNDLKCANLLLKKGASANIPNNKGLTALHLAAIKDQQEMVELILNKYKQYPDLDNYKHHNGQTTREIIEQKLPQILLLSAKREVNMDDLKQFLSVNDETNFVKNLKLVKLEHPYYGGDDLLVMAVQRDLHRAVINILELAIQEVRLMNRINITNAGRVAVRRGRYAILREILTIKPNIASTLLMDICMELGKPEIDNMSERLKCLKLILEQKDVKVRCTDDKDNTPLHYAAKAGCEEAVILLLRQGSYIGHMNMFKEPPIANISEKTLSSVFDDCVQSQNEWTNKYTIDFNYRCLMPHIENPCCDNAHEMEVFKHIYRYSHLKHLLKHPLLSSFLYLKWHRIQHLLYANFVFYATFYIVLNAYILEMVFNNPSNDNCNMTSKNCLEDICDKNSFLKIFATVLLLLFTFCVILQFIFHPRYYLADLENWMQVVLIVLTFAFLHDARLQIGTVVILLSAWKMMMLISQHPRMSTSIEIFRTVFFNFICILIPYLLLILAFALAFYMLFKDSKNFSNPSYSFFNTIIMFTGEFDIGDILFISHPIWGRIIFVLFVFLITIVLFNLLNGLAVRNTTDILSKAELVGLVSRVRLIACLENVIIPSFSVSRFQKLYDFIGCEILLFPYYLNDGKISFKPYDSQNPYDNKHYIRSISGKDGQYWTTLRMDPNIIKRSKQIISVKNRLEDNEKIMTELNNVRLRLETIESYLI